MRRARPLLRSPRTTLGKVRLMAHYVAVPGSGQSDQCVPSDQCVAVDKLERGGGFRSGAAEAAPSSDAAWRIKGESWREAVAHSNATAFTAFRARLDFSSRP